MLPSTTSPRTPARGAAGAGRRGAAAAAAVVAAAEAAEAEPSPLREQRRERGRVRATGATPNASPPTSRAPSPGPPLAAPPSETTALLPRALGAGAGAAASRSAPPASGNGNGSGPLLPQPAESGGNETVHQLLWSLSYGDDEDEDGEEQDLATSDGGGFPGAAARGANGDPETGNPFDALPRSGGAEAERRVSTASSLGARSDRGEHAGSGSEAELKRRASNGGVGNVGNGGHGGGNGSSPARGFCADLSHYFGVGLVVGVGYTDPGNWATDLAGGARYGFDLLSVVALSSGVAMLFQYLALKLGIATGKDLAVVSREALSPSAAAGLWIVLELAVAATDLAELLGSAVALQLLLGVPLGRGVLLTAADVFLILLVQRDRMRVVELIVAFLSLVVFLCLFVLVAYAAPPAGAVLRGFLPDPKILADPHEVWVGVGILGATVMPHNLFLHSALVHTRRVHASAEAKVRAVRSAALDSNVSLTLAFVVNGLILILAAAAFHRGDGGGGGGGGGKAAGGGGSDVDIGQAFHLLSPLLGVHFASFLFGLALLAAGQQASITGTIAGQIIMEGMVNIHVAPWKRRLLTRLVAMVPAIVVTAAYPDSAATDLLVLSQIILSATLPFAAVPLVLFTSREDLMGPELVNAPSTQLASWAAVLVVSVLNVYLVVSTIFTCCGADAAA